MKTMADYSQTYAASLQPAVPEAILAVGVLSRPGAMGAVLASQLSGGAWMVMNHKGKKQSGGLPQNVVLALTPTSVYVFNFKPGWGGKLKIKAPIAVWRRDTFMTSIDQPGSLAARVHFHFVDGSEIQLDWNRGFGGEGFNAPLLNALVRGY